MSAFNMKPRDYEHNQDHEKGIIVPFQEDLLGHIKGWTQMSCCGVWEPYRYLIYHECPSGGMEDTAVSKTVAQKA